MYLHLHSFLRQQWCMQPLKRDVYRLKKKNCRLGPLKKKKKKRKQKKKKRKKKTKEKKAKKKEEKWKLKKKMNQTITLFIQ